MSMVEEKTGDLDVKSGEWISFLDGFSRQHEDWLASIEVVTATGRLTEVKNGRLKGVSVDHADGKQSAYVQVGDAPNERVTHVVTAPVRITLKQTQTGAHEGLEIMSADGSLTTIRFRCAIRPDMIDDIAS
jgi:hypothetical protein